MSRYFNETQELYHYGVIGMKWGRRRNILQAYAKAQSKSQKLNDKAQKAQIKLGKASRFRLTKAGRQKQAAKMVNVQAKTNKAVGRAAKWDRATAKAFSQKKLSKIEAGHRAKAESYLQKSNLLQQKIKSGETQATASTQRKIDKYNAKAQAHTTEANNVNLVANNPNEAIKRYNQR